jgi:hypothetical protein
MLIYQIKGKDYCYEEYVYRCTCHDTRHSLSIQLDKETGNNELCILGIINADNQPFWYRFKEAIKLIFGGRIYYIDIVINSKDKEELGNLLLRKNNDNHSN